MNDCPVCYEPMIEGNENCAMSGINCNHTLCIPCYCKITSNESDNKKCPICRAELTDSDNETENIFDGYNERPLTNLFFGRRFFNTETNKIEYYHFSINENGFYNSWTNVEKRYFSTFIKKYLSGDNIVGCCAICGIQRTEEVNEFMKNKYPEGFIVGEDDWDNYFIDGYNCCYECHNMFHKLNEVFYD